MKPQTNSSATTRGPFLKLVLAVAEQRAQIDCNLPARHTVNPLPAQAITAVIEEVVSQEEQPVCRNPLALGPFLTMFLTLGEREFASPGPWLVSSIVPASTR